MRKVVLGFAVAAALPMSAQAVVYDAFTSFNATQGAGNFYYGEIDPANPLSSGSLFTASTVCFIDNAQCLQLANDHDVPGFTKGGAPVFQYGSVNVPNDRLLAHPDNDADLTFIRFLAPTAGFYNFSATFNIQDVNPSGVAISLIRQTAGGLPIVITPLSVITGANSSYTFSQSFALGANEFVGFGLGNNGFYGNDSTGVNVTVSVPEPASWAMMVGGFGLLGASLRASRRKVIFA